jgi:hypothetical protein
LAIAEICPFNYIPDGRIKGFVGGREDGGAIFGLLDGLLEAAAKLANVAGELAQTATLLLLKIIHGSLFCNFTVFKKCERAKWLLLSR